MNPSQTLGKYTLRRKLAVGGMAEIWLAAQSGPAGFEKTLVVKRILPHLADDEKFVEMFLDEARLAAKLEHPNVVRISDLGEADGSYYIAMEYIDGVDLDYIIERCTQLGVGVPLKFAARIMADALGGLDYAHNYVDRDGTALGLVHRDISPHNILVNRSGVAKVVDFGVAKAATSTHKTQTGAVKGKFAYMSPEQIANAELDPRSDIFAMGIVLYELTTNQRPFGEEGAELMAVTAILTKPPTNPRELVDDFPPQMEKIILRALAKERDERYTSAAEMQRALEAFIAEQGEIVTQRDLADYLEDLFSDAPTFLEGSSAPPVKPRFDVPGSDEIEPGNEDVTVVGEQTPTQPAENPVTDLQQEPPPSPSPPPVEPPQEPPDVPVAEPSIHTSPGVGGGGPSKAIVVVVLVLLLGLVGAGVLVTIYVVSQSGDSELAESDAGEDTAGSDDDSETDEAVALGEPDVGGSDTATTAGADEADAEVSADAAVAESDVDDEEMKVDDMMPATGAILIGGLDFPCRVSHDGKDLGITPGPFTLPGGEQTLVLMHPEKPVEKEIKVTVQPGEVVEVKQQFTIGTLILKVVPKTRTEVWIDGRPITTDPNEPIDLPAGEHMVKVKSLETGFVSQKATEIVAGKKNTLRISLQ